MTTAMTLVKSGAAESNTKSAKESWISTRIHLINNLVHAGCLGNPVRRAVLKVLAENDNAENGCSWASNADIAVSTGCSMSSVTNALYDFQKMKLITRDTFSQYGTKETVIHWDRIRELQMSKGARKVLKDKKTEEKTGRGNLRRKRTPKPAPGDTSTVLPAVTNSEEVDVVLGSPEPSSVETATIKTPPCGIEEEVMALLRSSFPHHPTYGETNSSAIMLKCVRACLKQADSDLEGLEVFRMGCHAPSLAPDRASLASSNRLGGMLQGKMFGRWVGKYRAEIQQYRKSLSYLCLGGNRVAVPNQMAAPFADMEEWIKRTTGEHLIWIRTEEEEEFLILTAEMTPEFCEQWLSDFPFVERDENNDL